MLRSIAFETADFGISHQTHTHDKHQTCFCYDFFASAVERYLVRDMKSICGVFSNFSILNICNTFKMLFDFFSFSIFSISCTKYQYTGETDFSRCLSVCSRLPSNRWYEWDSLSLCLSLSFISIDLNTPIEHEQTTCESFVILLSNDCLRSETIHLPSPFIWYLDTVEYPKLL